MIGLQHHVMRAARAHLDPMLSLGLLKPEEAAQVLSRDVVLSEGMLKQATPSGRPARPPPTSSVTRR